jgi:hypothetical protein
MFDIARNIGAVSEASKGRAPRKAASSYSPRLSSGDGAAGRPDLKLSRLSGSED